MSGTLRMPKPTVQASKPRRRRRRAVGPPAAPPRPAHPAWPPRRGRAGEHVAAAELHVELVAAALLPGDVQHLLRDVHSHHPALRPTARRRAKAKSPVPQQTSSADAPGPTPGQHDPQLAPAMVQPGGHEVVQPVVRAGDAVEHLPDLARLGRGVDAGPGGRAPAGLPAPAGREYALMARRG